MPKATGAIESLKTKPRVADTDDLDAPEFQVDDDASATGVGRGIASNSGIAPSADVAAASASGNADRVMARCGRPTRNVRPVQVYVQVYDEAGATRSQDAKSIDPQFEYNRFTRAWHEANPAGHREDLLRDWAEYRRLPLDQRGRA